MSSKKAAVFGNCYNTAKTFWQSNFTKLHVMFQIYAGKDI